MALHFLDFDYSEDEDGLGTWDAMASVPARRLGELVAELESILAWAHATFGEQLGPQEEGGLWDYDLQCEQAGQPLRELRFAPQQARLVPPLVLGDGERVTLNFSLSGAPAFGQAFTARFGVPS